MLLSIPIRVAQAQTPNPRFKEATKSPRITTTSSGYKNRAGKASKPIWDGI